MCKQDAQDATNNDYQLIADNESDYAPQDDHQSNLGEL